MSSWIDAVSNPQALSEYDKIPSLSNVELMNLGFRQGLDCMDVYFSLRELPRRRSHRWPENMNAISMSFELWGDLAVSLTTATPFRDPLDVNCALHKHEDGLITLECFGQGVSLAVKCTAARVAHLAGYIRPVPGSKEATL
jgi:hypothetical protein